MLKVSVLMPIYNTNEQHLREAIESVLRQTFDDFEFLILNDSPENTMLDDIVASYGDDRIKYIKNDKNMGITPSRNKLMRISAGKYLAVMDHDDISLPERFAKEVEVLDNNPDVGVVSTWYKVIGVDKVKKRPETNEKIEFAMVNKYPVIHSASMIRKSVLLNNKINYDETTSPCEDFDLWWQLVGKTKFYNIQEVLFFYRTHENQTSSKNLEKMKQLRLIILKKYKKIHPKLFSKWRRLINRIF